MDRVGDTDRQTDGQRELGTEGQAGSWAEKVRDRETCRQMDRELGTRERQADRHTEKGWDREREKRGRHRDREAKKETGQRETDGQRHRAIESTQ